MRVSVLKSMSKPDFRGEQELRRHKDTKPSSSLKGGPKETDPAFLPQKILVGDDKKHTLGGPANTPGCRPGGW